MVFQNDQLGWTKRRQYIYSLTQRIEPKYLSSDKGNIGEINPHAFINPADGILMAEDMRDAFIEKDPARKEQYEERAAIYLERLRAIDEEYRNKINAIHRVKCGQASHENGVERNRSSILE